MWGHVTVWVFQVQKMFLYFAVYIGCMPSSLVHDYNDIHESFNYIHSEHMACPESRI